MRGPQPLSQRVVQTVRSRASSFNFHYLLFYWRSTRSCLRLLLLCLRILSVLSFLCLVLARQLPVGQDLLIHEISISHTSTHHSR